MPELSETMRSAEFTRLYTAMESSGTQKGIIYIEDATDRPFWEKVLNAVCPGRYDIKPFGQPGSEGKRRLEQEYAHLNKDRLVAVDGDYDYICPQRNEYASCLVESKFVLHTFFYSRESYINTYEAVSHLTDCLYLHVKPDSMLLEALQQYSRTIYPALCLFTWLHNKNQQRFPENHFNMAVMLPDGRSLLNSDLTVNEFTFSSLQQKVEIYISEYSQYIDNEQGYQEHIEALATRGINADHAYLFTDGHYLLDAILHPMLKIVSRECLNRDKAWVEERYPQAAINHRKRQVINHYKDHCNTETLLFHCDAYRTEYFWLKITQKLRDAMKLE